MGISLLVGSVFAGCRFGKTSRLYASDDDRTAMQVMGRPSECEAEGIEGHTFCCEGCKRCSNCMERSVENELKHLTAGRKCICRMIWEDFQTLRQ